MPLPEEERTSEGPVAPRGLPRVLAVGAYMALVFALSHTSHPPIRTDWFAHSDKFFHAVEYLPLGYLLASTLGGPAKRRFLLGALMAALFGVSDEVHQAFVPHRSPSALDLLADTLGGTIGAWLAVFFRAAKKL